MMIMCDDDDDDSDDYDYGDYTSDTFVDATMYVVDERQCLLQQALIQSEATIDDFTVPCRDSVAI